MVGADCSPFRGGGEKGRGWGSYGLSLIVT